MNMNRLDSFERNLMTASTAEYLANHYGQGADIDTFAEGLPQDARVIDVGAGLSDFGHAIAKHRPDISWTNFDINYDTDHLHPQRALVEEARATAPENLEFRAGDVLQLPPELQGQYDRVYSYNLVTHLLRIKRDLGRQALTNMLGLLDEDGQLAVGPTNAKMASSKRWDATTLPAGASEEEVMNAEALLTTPRAMGIFYNASNASGVGVYPAKRFNTSGGLVLSDDGGQTTHRLFSPRGVVMASRLAVGILRA